MNVLIVNGNLNGGGAATIAKKLVDGLRQRKNVNVFFLIARGNKKACDIEVLFSNILQFILHRVELIYTGNVCYHNKVAQKKIIDIIIKNHIDVVHFHNIANNYIGFEDIKVFSRYCKVVWTLHELWSVTGHCYHPMECGKWISGECLNCNNLKRPGKLYWNNSGKIWERKKRAFVNQNIHFVVPSVWMKEQIDKSFLKNEDIRLIHNGINLEQFVAFNKELLRKERQISLEKRVLLFVSSELNNRAKGLDIYLEALKKLQEKECYLLIFVGEGTLPKEILTKYEVIKTGKIADHRELNIFYSLADVLVQSSEMESFSLTSAEAMASGTPVIAFRAGGVEEIVNNENGWIMENRLASTLRDGIENIYSNYEELLKKQRICRSYIETHFSVETMISNHIKLYEEIISNG